MKVYALLLAIAISGAHVAITSAFTSPSPIASQIQPRPHCLHQRRPRKIALYAAADEDDESSNEEESVGFTALPPIGGSSFWENVSSNSANDDGYTSAYESSDLARPGNSNDGSTNKNNNNIIISAEHTALVSPKFQLQYTCKICNTRNSHSVTRMAYQKGVVIAFCKGCKSKHLIADNLGWSNYIGGFDFDNGETNIEMYMQNKDREARESGGMMMDEDGSMDSNDLVMRVNQNVFDLESMLHKGQDDSVVSASATDGDDQADGEMSWS